MIRYFLTLLATCSLALAATGDVSVVINTDGWSCDVYVQGFTTGATISTGHTGDYNDVSASTPYLTVVSKGFTSSGTATTTTRTVYLGSEVRKPYPNDADRDEDTTTVSGSLRTRFSLSHPIYAKDDTGAGNSGTAPTFTAPSGFLVNTGGASQNSNARSAAAVVTNNSSLAYPKVIGQWDWYTTKAFRRKTGNFDIGFNATHAFGIAGVRLDATGLTSGANSNSTVTTVTKIGPMQNGLYFPSYKMAVPIAGFTQGEQIRLRARVWPTVGDDTEDLDTEDITGLTQAGNGRIEVTCDKTSALISYGVVRTAATGGDDVAGATSTSLTTAENTPYATVAEAINDNATVIILTDNGTGTHSFTQTPIKSPAYQLEIIPHPSDVAANITLSVSSALQNVRCKNLYIGGGINVNLGGAGNYLDGNTGTYSSTITIDGVQWDGTSSSQRGNLWRWGIATFINCDLNAFNMAVAGTDHFCWSAVGTTLNSPVDETINEVGAFIACDQGTNKKITMTAGGASNPGHLSRNMMFEFNRLDKINATNGTQWWGYDTAGIAGDVSFRGNVLINTTTNDPDLFLFNNGLACDNVLIRHNTMQGFPLATMYNSSGTTSLLKTNVFYSGNAVMRMSTKSDTFDEDGPGTAEAPNGNRVGNWGFLYGCGIYDNRIAGSIFALDWHGFNAGVVGGVGDTDYTDMGYTTDNSGYGAATGGGDYTPTSGSVLRNAMLASRAFINFDLYGTDIPTSGNMDIGGQINATAGGGGGGGGGGGTITTTNATNVNAGTITIQ